MFGPSDHAFPLLDFRQGNSMGGRDVDLALKLNVVAACIAFAFIGAILFGAF